MRRFAVIAAALAVGASAAMASGVSSAQAVAVAPGDSASVAAATVLATMMKEQIGSFRARGVKIDDAAFLDAFNKQFTGKPTGFTVDEADRYMTDLFMNLEAAAHPKADQAAQQAFIEQMKAVDGAVVTPSGLIFQVISEGEGVSPTDDDVAIVDYTGRLADGTVFDGSRGQTVEFPVSGLIPGFTEGLKMMKPGGEYRLIIPAAIGYGSRGAGPIPGDAVLDFTVKLEGIKAK